MSNVVWLVLSWLIIAIGCYYVVFVLGRQSNTATHEDEDKKKGDNKKVHAETDNVLNNKNSTTFSTDKLKGNDAKEVINAIVSWIHNYSGIRFGNLQNEIITAFDEASKRVLNDLQDKVDLRFEKPDYEEGQFAAPEVLNFNIVDGPSNQLAAHAQVVLNRVMLKLLVSKQKNDRYFVNTYEALLTNLTSNIEIRLAQIGDHAHIVICFLETPKNELILYDTQKGRISGPEANEIHNLVNKSIEAAIINLKLSSLIDVNALDTFTNDPIKQLYRSTDNSTYKRDEKTHAAKLLRVNVVRAYDLKIHDQIIAPFVVVEMDEPQKKHITSPGQTSSPNWDETFEFDLSKGSDEILFEIYNPRKQHSTSDENSFLGLAIVGINELLSSHNPVQYLKLQGRPNHNDVVHGTLLVQFEFLSDQQAAQVGTNSTQVKINQPDGRHFSETYTESVKPLMSTIGGIHNNFEPIKTKTTTITVKGIQKIENTTDVSSKLDAFICHDNPDDRYLNSKYGVVGNSNMVTSVSEANGQHHDHSEESPSQQTIVARNSTIRRNGSPEQSVKYHEQSFGVKQSSSPHISNPYDASEGIKGQHFNFDSGELGYGNQSIASRRSDSEKRKRNRSFFGDLKERLSRKRYTRSKSADPANLSLYGTGDSFPPSRDQSREPLESDFEDHARFAGDKNKCTLVLELQQSGETKYYLIPPSIAREPAATQLLKKGKKLHLCKDHTFVAVKSTGGITCSACKSKIVSGFNKQAYQCRACRLICHKGCHTHIQFNCHQNNSLKLSLAKDVDWAHCLSHSQIGEYISAENL